MSRIEWEREAVVVEAMTWLGTPHAHMARVKHGGVDCGQFVAAVFEDLGLIEPMDLGIYPPDWYMHRDDSRYLEFVERNAFKLADDATVLPGDIALFNFGRCIGHGGIVIEWPTVIHAYVPNGEVMLDDVHANARLKERCAGVWRLFRWR